MASALWLRLMVPIYEGVIKVIQVGKRNSDVRNTSTATTYVYYPFVIYYM